MARKVALITLALLVASLVVNVIVFIQARHLYEARLLDQFWPAGSPFVPPDVPAGETDILLFGDSRMADWGTPVLGTARTVNGGASGLTTSQLALRLPAWLDACHPKVVVMEAGINDLKIIGLRPDLYETVISQSRSNFNAMIDQCRRHQAQVILLPVWPPGPISPLRRLVWNPDVDRAVTDLNQRLSRAVSGQKDVVWLDLMALLSAQSPGEGRESLYRDDLHLKKEVYLKLTPLLDQALMTKLPNQ